MRLGIVTGEFPPLQGGVGDFTRELANALGVAGHEVHVITDARCKTPDAGSLYPASCILHPVVRRWNWPTLFYLRRLARALNLDVLNIQYQAAAYGMTPPIHFLPPVAGNPSVVTFHDLRVPYLFPKAGRLRWRAVLALARGANAVIVTNPGDELTLRQAGNVRRLAQIPIGSNVTPSLPANYNRDEWRRRIGVHPDNWLLGYFGFLNASKGGETLVRTLARLKGDGCPAHLLLIGGRVGTSDPTNAGYGDRVDALAKAAGVEELMVRTGFVTPEEVSAHLTACDVIVLPYRDGVSFRRGSLMAALAHGCPIVSTHAALPLPEVREGENMRLAPPDDPAACARAVCELMQSPESRRRLSDGARKLAEQFTWEKIAGRTVEVFEAVRYSAG